jgi:hypothetical protein
MYANRMQRHKPYKIQVRDFSNATSPSFSLNRELIDPERLPNFWLHGRKLSLDTAESQIPKSLGDDHLWRASSAFVEKAPTSQLCLFFFSIARLIGRSAVAIVSP